MELRALVIGFLAWALYPIWLAAGALDYLCHRNTDIEHTSGVAESWLHVAQLAVMGVIVALAALAEISLTVWIVLVVAALVHSALAFVDVSYTQDRRRISPLEQLAHSFLEVLPLIAVALLAIVHWPLQRTPAFSLDASIGPAQALLLGSFAVLAGMPVLEELVRTYRASSPRAANAPKDSKSPLSRGRRAVTRGSSS